MALIKKRDLADHYAARRLKRNQVQLASASQPDATGFSGSESVRGLAKPMGFFQDFTADHSSSGKPVLPAADSKAAKALPSRPSLRRAAD